LQQKVQPAPPLMRQPVSQEPEKKTVTANNEDAGWSFFDSL
jgi:hypothetical protein